MNWGALGFVLAVTILGFVLYIGAVALGGLIARQW